MRDIKEILKNKKYSVGDRGKKRVYEWQALADEMGKFFRVKCFWLFWKYPRQMIYEAYQECRKKNINKFCYLIGILIVKSNK